MNQPELMNLYASTSGVFPGEGEVSRFDFRERVESAARVGFSGVGLWHTDLEHIRKTLSYREMKDILEDNGIKHLELEFLTDWFVDGPARGESDRWRKLLFEASAELGARHIKVGDFQNTPCPFPQLAEAFANLCSEAREYGATIGYEMMASSRIHTWDEALALVETAGVPNGGLILDIVHLVALDIPFTDLKRLPVASLVNVELNDGYGPGDARHNPAERLFCGEGEFDLVGFVEVISGMGYRGPWAVEVFNHRLADWSLDQLNQRAYDTTRPLFSETD